MRKWAADNLPRGDKLSLLLLLVVLVLTLATVLVPGPVPVLGNLHDLFIPLNAAEVVRDGVTLHQQFHSPFGWIYFYLNHASDVVMAALAPWASTPGTLMLSGLVFFGPVLAIWFLFRRAAPESPALGLWLLPFLLVLMVSPREASEFTHKNLLWYGLYNNHNWGVVLLQAALFAALARGISRVDARLLGLGLSACVYLTAHYKISFLFSSLLLAAGCLWLLPPHSRVRVAIMGGLSFLLLCLVTWFAGYDYAGYLNDIAMAFNAKVAAGFGYAGVILVSVLVLAATVSVLANARFAPRVALGASSLAVAGIAVAVAGDWSGYLGYPFLFLSLVLISAPGHWNGRTISFWLASFFLALNFTLNIMSVGRVLQLKLHGEDKPRYVEAVIRQHDGRDMHVVVREPETLTLNSLSTFYNVDDEDVWVKLATFDVPDRRVVPRYENIEYMRAHEEALAWMASRARPEIVVGEVEFANAFPVLTGRGELRGLHWLHLDNTLRVSHLPDVLEHVLDWDVVLIPVASADGLAQVRLSCAALDLIRRQAPDTGLARATAHYLYLVRNADKADRERWHELDGQIVQSSCEAVAEKARS